MPNQDTILQIYYDHYKDTYEQIKRYISKRDRITIHLFILLSIIAFIVIDTDKCEDVTSSLLKTKLGISGIGFSIFNTSALYLLLYSCFGYYQICLLIERSYVYLHNVENTLSQMSMCNIDRESGWYLSDYPTVSNIAHWFYTYVLPFLVIVISIIKAKDEWPTDFVSLATLDIILIGFIVVVSLIYIIDRIKLQHIYIRKKIVNIFTNMKCRSIIKLIVVIAILCVVPFLLPSMFSVFFNENTGHVGDTIGGTTAPFVGLVSIVLLYWTLREQQQFNKKQQASNEAQTQLIRDEQFKSSFFMLLQEQRDILKSLQASCPTLDKTTTKIKMYRVYGQDFFAMAIYELRSIFEAMNMPTYQSKYDEDQAAYIMECAYENLYIGSNLPEELKQENDAAIEEAKKINMQTYMINKFKIKEEEFTQYKDKSTDEKIAFVYSKFFTVYENCGYYFRHLYRILKYISTQECEDINMGKFKEEEVKQKYRQFVEIVQAQMSKNEMLICYYNCFLFPNAKDLISKYKLLENLSIESLIDKNHIGFTSEFGMKHRTEYVF